MSNNSKNKCECWHEHTLYRYLYDPITGEPIPHDETVGECWGTKEKDRCDCGGDQSKCDFYDNVREECLKAMTIKYRVIHNQTGEDITGDLRYNFWLDPEGTLVADDGAGDSKIVTWAHVELK